MQLCPDPTEDVEEIVLMDRLVQSELEIINLRLKELRNSSTEEAKILKELRTLCLIAKTLLEK